MPTSAASGDWSVGATWVGGVAPSNDATIIAAGHTVTVDDATATCSTLAINGTLSASRTANSTLTFSNAITINSTGLLDWGSEASPIPTAYTARLTPTGANSTINLTNASYGGRFTMRGSSSRNSWTTLASTANAAATVLACTDATGWQDGDELLLVPASATDNAANHIEVRTIATGGVSGNNVTITAGLTYAHIAGCRVFNMTRNCLIQPVTGGGGTITVETEPSINTPLSSYFRYARFKNVNAGGGAAGFFNVNGHGQDISSVAQIEASRAIDDWSDCVFWNSQNNATPIFTQNAQMAHRVTVYDSLLYDSTSGGSGTLLYRPRNMIFDGCVLAANDNICGTYNQIAAEFEGKNSWICCGTLAGTFMADGVTGNGVRLEDCIFSGYWRSVFPASTMGKVKALRCDFGATYGLRTQYGFLINLYGVGGHTEFESDGCSFNTYSDAFALSRFIQNDGESYAEMWNKGGSTAVQEYYTTQCRFSREVTVVKGSTSSLKAELTTTENIPQTYSFQIPAKSGEALKVIGYLRKNADYGASTRPSIAASFDGTLLDTYTLTDVTDTWERFELDFSQSSGTDGLVDIEVTVQSASATGVAYLSGLSVQPFVTRSRHYGYVFNETSATQVVNITTSASEATAAAYTGITVSWGATSYISAIAANHTLQELYDYTQAQGCLNVGFAMPVTGAGVAGNPALFAAGAITVSDGYVLNGAGSLSMGSNLLSSEFAGGVNYTYTGGTWSQLTTVPTFSGGQVNLGTAGTYTFGVGSDTILSMTPAAASDYNMGGLTVSGTLDLRNTTAHAINVSLPAGTSYTTANNTGGTITVTVPTIERGQLFTGLIAGSQVKVLLNSDSSEIFSDNASSTSETWDDATSGDIVVDYVIQKAGYDQIRVVGVTVTSGSITTVPITQAVARWYVASSGLTINTNCFANATTKKFGLTTTSTLQNFASYLMEQWIALGDAGEAYANKAFPLSANGPNSFTWLDGWEADLSTYADTITNLSRDGMRYLSSAGVMTASWAAILTAGVSAGMRVRFQQVEGTTQSAAVTSGNMDQLIQIYGDATHGNFDYRAYLVCKVQEAGYDESYSDVVANYGNLEDQLYVVALNPLANGVATGDPALTITITDHGASPVTWNGIPVSITITDNASASTGTNIMRELRYNFEAGGTYQGTDAFNWHDLVQTNGADFKTVRGTVYGDTGAALKGVRVVQSDGSTPHADFTLFTGDDGTTYSPTGIYQTVTVSGAVAGSRLQIYDTTSSTELYNGLPTFPYTWTDGSVAAADRAIRVRVTKVSGATAKILIEANIGTCGQTEATAAVSYLVSQSDDSTYNTNAVDGSTVTGITFTDAATDLVNVNLVGGSTTWQDIYAAFVYWMNTATGIADDIAYVDAVDPANYILTSMKIKNTSSPSVALTITGGYGRDVTSGTIVDIIDTTGGNIFPLVDHVVSTVVSVGGVNIITGDIADIPAAPTASANAAAVLSAAATAPIYADVRNVTGLAINGTGTALDPWGP